MSSLSTHIPNSEDMVEADLSLVDPVKSAAADRSLRAQIAAHDRWGRTADRAAATAPARAGLRAKFARQIDPDGELASSDPAELERRIDSLQRSHMLRMSLASKKARAERAGDAA